MKHFLRLAFFYRTDPAYQQEFFREINLENVKKSYVIARLGMFFLGALLILDFLRYMHGELWSDQVHVWSLYNHSTFIVFALPVWIYHKYYGSIREKTFKKGRRFTHLTLVMLAFTLLPMTVLGILDRGTLTLYAIFLFIGNLFLQLSHRDRICLNIASFIIILTAIVLIRQGGDTPDSFVRVVECLGLQLPTFVFSTFQHNLKIRQFANEKLLKEQKDVIEREKQRSDDLLRNILPVSVAEELKAFGQVRPRHYDQVTVLFADFKGFSKICRSLPPEQLIADLNHCFGQFDAIATRLGLERVKTIGDSYMCVGGIAEPRPDDAVRMVEAAFAMQDFLAQWRQERAEKNLPGFHARIGIHSGSVVAGIVGTTKFAFDIWGETVNIAARMEDNGEPGKVNISGSTYDLVKQKFSCEYRGKIPIKNIGEAEMYFVG